MSVRANCVPLFQPWKRWTVLDTVSRKIDATIERRGLCPCAPPSVAFRTKNAARMGARRPTITFVTKLWKLLSIPASHELVTPPPACGICTPCPANQDNNCGTVSRITVQRIHRPKRPPDSKFTPPSLRNATPASTSVHIAPGTARSSSSCNRSLMNWGRGMSSRFLYPARALIDPELDQARQTRDGQQPCGRDRPAHHSSTFTVVNHRHHHSN